MCVESVDLRVRVWDLFSLRILCSRTLEVEQTVDVSMLKTDGKGMNLVSEIPGASGDRYILVGAHYDSIPRSGPAPGAEDNGSGVATLLSIAKMLKVQPLLFLYLLVDLPRHAYLTGYPTPKNENRRFQQIFGQSN